MRQSNDPFYVLLRDEHVQEFNRQRQPGTACDLSALSFRGRDLRGLDARQVNFQDAYFRDADLRGIDFREANLEGASLAHAKVSGCYFPPELSADELRLSVEYGTRLRYRR